MSLRKKIEDKIAKKNQENIGFQEQISLNNIQIQAWQDVLKMIPKDDDSGSYPVKKKRVELRAGSDVDVAYKTLQLVGTPLHINELLATMNRPQTKENRISLASSIQAYVRRGVIFKKTAPNTFGLIADFELEASVT